MELISLDAFRSAVRAEIDLAGEDFVYVAPPTATGVCVYVHDGKPSCLVGRALARLGVSVPTLRAYDTGDLGGGVPARQIPLFDPGARKWVNSLQMHQDAGRPWGFCYNVANGVLMFG